MSSAPRCQYKPELEAENEGLRSKMEQARELIDEALDLEVDDEDDR